MAQHQHTVETQMLEHPDSAEQKMILRYRREKPGRPMKIIAGSGTGKTKTICRMGEDQPEMNGLYIAFGKPAQLDAERRLPRNIRARTSHSLAFSAMNMRDQIKRLAGGLKTWHVLDVITPDHRVDLSDADQADLAIQTVTNFCNSASRTISSEHLPGLPDSLNDPEIILRHAERIWREVCDRRSSMPIEHDYYLKLWSLSDNPRLPRNIDEILLDEAQDSNPPLLHILRQCGIPLTAIGDPYQQIYRFRGAVDALANLPYPSFHLSQSWRFGQNIADIANAVLAHASNPPEVILKGNPARQTEIGPVSRRLGQVAVLCRTNMGVFTEIIATSHGSIHVIGGIEPILQLIRNGFELWRGNRVPNDPVFSRFEVLAGAGRSRAQSVGSRTHDHDSPHRSAQK